MPLRRCGSSHRWRRWAGAGDGQQGKGQGQRPGQLIGLGDAQGLAGAVAVREEGAQGAEGGGGAHLGQGKGAEQMEQAGDGVDALLRQGGVGALAAAEDVQAVPLLAQLVAHAGLGGGPVAIGAGGPGGQAGHQALGLRREHVDAEAAAELGHPGGGGLRGPGLGEHRLIAALLGVDEGELRVGGEGIGGVGLPGVVVGDVAGAALLVGAHQQAGVAPEGDAQLLHGLHGQQDSGHGALVIVGAPAVEHAVHLLGRIGLRHCPAGALAHHVQVAENVKGGLLVVEIGGAHVVIVVAGGKAQLFGQLQTLRQGGGGAGAEGHARQGLLPHAANAYQPGDGLHQLSPALRGVKIGVDFFLVHGVIPPRSPPHGRRSAHPGIYRPYTGRPGAAWPQKAPTCGRRKRSFGPEGR